MVYYLEGMFGMHSECHPWLKQTLGKVCYDVENNYFIYEVVEADNEDVVDRYKIKMTSVFKVEAHELELYHQNGKFNVERPSGY